MRNGKPIMRIITSVLLCTLLCSVMLCLHMPKAMAYSDFCGRIYYNIDLAETIGQTIHIRGWAYDIAAKNNSLSLHLYCGKGADGASDPHGFSTNVYRADVNNTFGLSGNHGFDIYYATSETSTVRVMFYTFFADNGTPALIMDRDMTYRQEYTVSYNANGGSGAPAAQKKINGTALTLSSTKPTRTGYTFQGWATSATGSVAYQPGGSYTNNNSVTLYAVWKANTYQVTYNANGGSGAPSAQTKTYGQALTLSTVKPSRDGYTFQGWATSATGSVAYQPGGSYTSNNAVTLFAAWKINTYTITYDANGGSGAPDAQTKTHGQPLTLSSAVPMLTGHDFCGWSSPDGAAVYQPGSSYSAEGSAILTAVWNLQTFTVRYDANGGSGAPEDQIKYYGIPLTLSSTIPLREDYVFLGWAIESDAAQIHYLPGSEYTANAHLTLHALWELDRLPGDVNGDSAVDGKDILRLLKYIAENPVQIVERNADVNNDGVVNGKDSLRMLKYFAEWDVTLE